MMLSPGPFRVNFSGQQHLAKNIGWLTSGTCERGCANWGIGDFGETEKKNGESLIESVTETRPCPVEIQRGGTPVPEGKTLGQQEDRSRVGGLFC